MEAFALEQLTETFSHQQQYRHEILYNLRIGHDMSSYKLEETSSWKSVGEKKKVDRKIKINLLVAPSICSRK